MKYRNFILLQNNDLLDGGGGLPSILTIDLSINPEKSFGYCPNRFQKFLSSEAFIYHPSTREKTSKVTHSILFISRGHGKLRSGIVQIEANYNNIW